MSFLEPSKSTATATIIAEGDNVSIAAIPTNFINLLFVHQPDLAGRFYSYLSQTIATRIMERAQDLHKSMRATRRMRINK